MLSLRSALRDVLDCAKGLKKNEFNVDVEVIAEAEKAKQGGKNIIGVHYVVAGFIINPPKPTSESKT